LLDYGIIVHRDLISRAILVLKDHGGLVVRKEKELEVW